MPVRDTLTHTLSGIETASLFHKAYTLNYDDATDCSALILFNTTLRPAQIPSISVIFLNQNYS